jgi:DNA repair exonuclease SbcCD ATPase subunit
MSRKRKGKRKHLYLLAACAALTGLGFSGCALLQESFARPDYLQAEHQLSNGNFQTSLEAYSKIVSVYPQAADEAHFEIGFILAHPKNPNRDYQKSLEAFRRLISEYPRSQYRVPSEMAAALVTELINQEKRASELKKKADTLEKRVETLNNQKKRTLTIKKQADTLEKQVETLEKQIEQLKEIDRSLEEKGRKLSPHP